MGLTSILTEWFREILIEGIMGNFTGLFDSLNEQAGEIATQVGTTPADWNASIFDMVRNLSDTVVLPIAGIILTFVLCYELIQMILEKNNMHEFDIVNIYKWIIKTVIAVYILSNTFDITMAIFDVAQWVIDGSADIVQGSLDMELALDALEESMEDMGLGTLIGLYLESAIINIGIQAMAICIFIIIYGRMLQIYLTVSIAPIPLATMVNREWGQLGNGYIKSMFALAFQGFLIMVCVAIYAALIQTIPMADDIHGAIWGCIGYTVLLCFCLFKTGSLSKSIFNAA